MPIKANRGMTFLIMISLQLLIRVEGALDECSAERAEVHLLETQIAMVEHCFTVSIDSSRAA